MAGTFGDFIKAIESSNLGYPDWTFDDNQHLPVVARWPTTDGPVSAQTHPAIGAVYLWHKEQCGICDTPDEVLARLNELTLLVPEPSPANALGDDDEDVPF